MNNLFTFLFFTILLSNVLTKVDKKINMQVQKQKIIHSIIDTFSTKGNTKELFKVWHAVYNIQYDFNTEEGINRYKVFKANLKMIQEHNSKNLGYTLGINEFFDKTPKELEAYFNIHDM